MGDLWQGGMRRKRTALALGAWIMYILALVPLYRLVGAEVTALVALPVAVMGWLFGSWSGLLASLLACLLNLVFMILAGETGWDTLLLRGLLGTLLLALVGIVVGRLRDLDEGMKRELAERKRAEDALRRHNRELALLNRASQALSATLDFDQVLATVLEEVRRLMDVIACSIWLVDPVTDELVCRQATGPQSQVVLGWRLMPGEGVAGWVAQCGESLIVSDAQEDERHSWEVDRRTGLKIRSILSIPLKAKQEIIGVLQVIDAEADRFSTADLMLLEPLAASAAVAIDNARLVEMLRRRTAELEARNEELRRFTYVASHNLRAPLVNLQGFAAELRSAFEIVGSTMDLALPYLTEEQQQAIVTALRENVPEALDFIDSSTAQMACLINALLKLSRLSHRTLKLERIDMSELTRTVLQALSHQIEKRQVRVIVGPLPEIIADRGSMRQIMDSLLSNAVLYLAPDRPGEIEITAESNRDETVFHIRDNGCGIAEGDMDKVFTPFRRVGRPEVPGEGMGLIYAQALVHRHGGRIWCESKLGEGTTFTFALPSYLGMGDAYA